jgi:hypothetical protein
MYKRTTADPLVRAFLDRYSLNLLQIPRTGAAVGDLYSMHGDRSLPPGRVSDFLDPTPHLPRMRRERLADLTDVVSDRVSVKAGVSLLEGFLAAIGAGGLSARVGAHYASRSGRELRFRLEEATREFVDVNQLGTALRGCRRQSGHPLADGYRYYLTVGVVRSQSLTVLAESTSAHDISLDAGLAGMTVAGGSVKIEDAGKAAVRYRGDTPVAIGVELVELVFDGKEGVVRFKPSDRALRVKGSAQKVWIGDDDSDAFVTLG